MDLSRSSPVGSIAVIEDEVLGQPVVGTGGGPLALSTGTLSIPSSFPLQVRPGKTLRVSYTHLESQDDLTLIQ